MRYCARSSRGVGGTPERNNIISKRMEERENIPRAISSSSSAAGAGDATTRPARINMCTV